MKKEYMTPEVEVINLTSTETVTTDDDVYGDMGLESSPF